MCENCNSFILICNIYPAMWNRVFLRICGPVRDKSQLMKYCPVSLSYDKNNHTVKRFIIQLMHYI